MKQIPLTRGRLAVCDDEDFEYLSQWKWSCHHCKGKFYAVRNTHRENKQYTVLMHRMILNCPPGLEIDHIDGDGLNNSKENIRIVTRAQNCKNNRCRSNVSGFIGVWKQTSGKWLGMIVVDKKKICLGTFKEKWLAARVYDKASLHFNGEFASLNFK